MSRTHCNGCNQDRPVRLSPDERFHIIADHPHPDRPVGLGLCDGSGQIVWKHGAPPRTTATPQGDTTPITAQEKPMSTELVHNPDALKILAAKLQGDALDTLDKGRRMVEVAPLLGGEAYDLKGITARITHASTQMALAALDIGASLLAVRTVEGHGEFMKWFEAQGFPFGDRMARKFMANTRRVIADPRLTPLLELGVSKAEMLLRSVTDEEAEELVEHGTVHGRKLDTYDAMGRRELEAELRQLREAKATADEQHRLDKEKRWLAIATKDTEISDLKEQNQRLRAEVAQARAPRPASEAQAERIRLMEKDAARLLGIFALQDPRAVAAEIEGAPAAVVAQAHAWYQTQYTLAKANLLEFERETGLASPAGLDAEGWTAPPIDTFAGPDFHPGAAPEEAPQGTIPLRRK